MRGGGGGEGRIWPKQRLFPCEKIDDRGSLSHIILARIVSPVACTQEHAIPNFCFPTLFPAYFSCAMYTAPFKGPIVYHVSGWVGGEGGRGG